MQHAIVTHLDQKIQLGEVLQSRLNDYKDYVKRNDSISANKEIQPNEKVSFLRIELERHRIISSNTISSFFLYLLKKFKINNIWQFSYLIQLITDANGILVFLKFLTEKFNQIPKEFSSLVSDHQMKFADLISNSVYKILKLMYLSCNSFPDKIRTFLLEYNAFVYYSTPPYPHPHLTRPHTTPTPPSPQIVHCEETAQFIY